MTTPTKILDHAERAKARLLEQFKGSATLTGLIAALAAEVQELEQVLWDIRASRAIDAAAGEQLDVLGRIVGLDRGGRDDATYRIWIRAWIRLLRSSGTPEDVLAVFAAITQGSTTIVLEEQFPAAFVIRVGSASIIDPAELAKIAQLAKAGGVQVIVEAATSLDTTSFAFDPNGAGYGTASAATDSTAAVGVGATVIPVLSSAGFAATDAIVVEPGANEETRVVQSVGVGTITVTVALAKSHALGIEVRKTPNTGGKMAAAF